MQKGQIFKNSKGETFEVAGMAGKSIVAKKLNGQCAYMFKSVNSIGVKIPKSFFSL